MKIKALECKNCGDTIFSRARHDFMTCSCGKVSVDGGFDYMKIVGWKKDFIIKQINVKETRKELYQDWNYNINKFGRISKHE